ELHELLAIRFHFLINTRFHLLVLRFQQLQCAGDAVLRGLDQAVALGEDFDRGSYALAQAVFTAEKLLDFSAVFFQGFSQFGVIDRQVPGRGISLDADGTERNAISGQAIDGVAHLALRAACKRIAGEGCAGLAVYIVRGQRFDRALERVVRVNEIVDGRGGYGIIARDLQRVGRSVFSGGLVQRDVDAVDRVLDSVALRRNRDGVVNEDFGVLRSYAFRHAIIRLRPAAAIVQHGLQAREVAGAVGAVLHFNGRDLAFSASGVCRNNKAMRLVAFAGTGIHQRSADFQIGTGVDSLNHVFKRRLVRIDRNGMGRVAHREFDIDLAAAAFHQRFSTLFTGVAGKRLSSGQLLNRDRTIARNGVGASFSDAG